MPKSKQSQKTQQGPVKGTKYLKFNEVFNRHVLNHIIIHKEDFKSQMRNKCFEDNNYDPFAIAEDYLKKSRFGEIDVVYKQNGGFGRFNAVGCRSLQSLAREIRHSIAKELYVDIDMVNAHPVILEHLCKEKGFCHSKLTDYINNRDKYLGELGVDRDIAKTIFLSLTNGGAKALNDVKKQNDLKETKFMDEYKDELLKIHQLFAKDDKEAYEKRVEIRKQNKKDYNHEAGYMNTLLCDFENKILNCIWEFYNNPTDAVLCFDGIMLRNNMDDYKLKECEEFVFNKLKIKITLKIKNMDEGFNFDNSNIMQYDEIDRDKLEKYNKIREIMKRDILEDNVNDNTMSKIFCEMMGCDLVVINEAGDGYIWCKKTKLWLSQTASELQMELCNEDNLILKAINACINRAELDLSMCDKDDADEKARLCKLVASSKFYRNKIQSTRNVKDIYTIAKKHFRNEKFQDEINRNHDLLPIKGGLTMELKTGHVRERQKNDLFSIECPVNFIDELKWTENDKLTNSKFINQIFMDNEEYIKYKQVKMGSYLSGRNTRDIDINHGCGRNGKSTLIGALAIIMGQFLGYIGKNVIVYDPKGHRAKNAGSHTSHLMPIDGKRLIITQELEENDTLDSEMVKKIASADPIEGVREVYGKKTRTIYPICKLVVSSNKIPKFDVQDKAIVDRLCFNPYNARFLNFEGFELEKSRGKFDESKYKYYDADNELIEKFKKEGREIDILFSWLVVGCIEFYKVMQNGIKKPQIVKDYIENKIGENDVVGLWLSEKCELIDSKTWSSMTKLERKNYTSQSAELYFDFSEWAKSNNCHSGYGKVKFYEHLTERATKRKTKNGYVFDRISLLSHDMDDD